MIDLTKEVILENATKMKQTEENLKKAIDSLNETCAWIETSFAGQNELDWVRNINLNKASLKTIYELTQKQAEKLQQIADLFDPE
ncbi:MAG: hypothetical protein PUD72_06130 [Oscillospiraceae bacterium]|nr:hypothetical protein [Oscillospiraceae bacterium]